MIKRNLIDVFTSGEVRYCRLNTFNKVTGSQKVEYAVREADQIDIQSIIPNSRIEVTKDLRIELKVDGELIKSHDYLSTYIHKFEYVIK